MPRIILQDWSGSVGGVDRRYSEGDEIPDAEVSQSAIDGGVSSIDTLDESIIGASETAEKFRRTRRGEDRVLEYLVSDGVFKDAPSTELLSTQFFAPENGDNSSAGSQDRPVKTIEQAITNLAGASPAIIYCQEPGGILAPVTLPPGTSLDAPMIGTSGGLLTVGAGADYVRLKSVDNGLNNAVLFPTNCSVHIQKVTGNAVLSSGGVHETTTVDIGYVTRNLSLALGTGGTIRVPCTRVGGIALKGVPRIIGAGAYTDSLARIAWRDPSLSTTAIIPLPVGFSIPVSPSFLDVQVWALSINADAGAAILDSGRYLEVTGPMVSQPDYTTIRVLANFVLEFQDTTGGGQSPKWDLLAISGQDLGQPGEVIFESTELFDSTSSTDVFASFFATEYFELPANIGGFEFGFRVSVDLGPRGANLLAMETHFFSIDVI